MKFLKLRFDTESLHIVLELSVLASPIEPLEKTGSACL